MNAPKQGEASAQEPDAQNQKRSVHAEGNHVGVDENAGADNAAHDDHGGVEYSEQLPRFDGVQESALESRCPVERHHVGSQIVTAITLP